MSAKLGHAESARSTTMAVLQNLIFECESTNQGLHANAEDIEYRRKGMSLNIFELTQAESMLGIECNALQEKMKLQEKMAANSLSGSASLKRRQRDIDIFRGRSRQKWHTLMRSNPRESLRRQRLLQPSDVSS